MVSVCIPTYNGADYLAEAIRSVLAQTLTDFELVIVDNHSTDGTPALVEQFCDSRIRYIRHERTIPLEDNWNFCLNVARGKYFKLLPHDDLLEASCLADQVAPLEADGHEELALVFGARRIIDHTGRELMVRGQLARHHMRLNGHRLIRRCVRAGANLIGEPGNGLVRTHLLPRIGGYCTRHPYMTDLDFWLRVLQHGDAHFTATTTSSFRVTIGSWSASIGRAQYQDFAHFVADAIKKESFGITLADKLVGLTKARLNTLARLVIYRAIARHGKRAAQGAAP